MMVRWALLLIFVSVPQVVTAAAPTIKGYMFGDYYHIASGPDKEENSFQFRRIYLTFDKKWNKRFSGRFRLESSDPGFGSGSKMTPVVKDAWLRYQKNGRTLVIGLSPTPTWSFTEGVWGYRSIEKTIIDLNGVGSSRDTGILFETPLDRKGRVKMQVMFGNGNSNKSEIDNDKKGYLRFVLKATKNAGATVYVDYESKPNDRDRVTIAGLLFSSTKDRGFGLDGVWQKRKNVLAGRDVAVRGISLFGRTRTQKRFGLFGRVDYFDPSDQASDAAITRIFVGADVMPDSNIHIMPNLIVESFQDSGLETVFIPRMTVYYLF